MSLCFIEIVHMIINNPRKTKNFKDVLFVFNYMLYTVELLDFVMAQFSWCSKVAIPYEINSHPRQKQILKVFY